MKSQQSQKRPVQRMTLIALAVALVASSGLYARHAAVAFAASPLTLARISVFMDDVHRVMTAWLPDGTPRVPPGEFKAIYLTVHTAQGERGEALISEWRSRGGNAVVFDVQDGNGFIVYSSKQLRDYVRHLHRNGMLAVARFVVFKVPGIVNQHQDWTLRDAAGRPWSNREGVVWLDPSHPSVREYVFDMTSSLAEAGVDEIQYDYIRFPERTANETYTYEKGKSRVDIITEFVCEASHITKERGIDLGLDLFGVVVWNKGYDGEIVGQMTRRLAFCADVIYPMVYPSHFNDGFAGVAKPALEPEFFVAESTKMFIEESYPDAVVRPWIQGFAYRVPNFDGTYVKRQIDALDGLAADGYAIWNASNVYESSFSFEQ